MKRCGRCGEEKPVSEFRVKNPRTGTLTSYCIPCIRANSKAHYEANKSVYLVRSKAHRAATRARNVKQMFAYLANHPCVDCGEDDVKVLEFDHLRDKKFEVSKKLSDRRWDSLLQEIAKCDVVCANCHRRRTARRAGFIRALLADQL